MDPFGLEPLLTDDLHNFATILSIAATVLSYIWPTGGLVLATFALAFDAGLYINDIVTSNFDEDVIQNAINSILVNAGFYAISVTSFATTMIPKLFYAMMDSSLLTLSLGDLANDYIDEVYEWLKKEGIL